MSAVALNSSMPSRRQRKSCWTGTPEIYFSKSIDNTRLVKVEDPRRGKEMKHFGFALCCLFILVMGYALQHFKAIEYGYKIEALKSQRESLADLNRALQLEESTLKSPGRIDVLARQFGMQPPQAGQVIRLDATSSDGNSAVMASAAPISVISLR